MPTDSSTTSSAPSDPFLFKTLKELEQTIVEATDDSEYKELWLRLQHRRHAFRSTPLLWQAANEFGLYIADWGGVNSRKRREVRNVDNDIQLLSSTLANVQNRLNDAQQEYYRLALENHRLLLELKTLTEGKPDDMLVEYTKSLLSALEAKLHTCRLLNVKSLLGLAGCDLETVKEKLLVDIEEKKRHLDVISMNQGQYERLAERYTRLLRLLIQTRSDIDKLRPT